MDEYIIQRSTLTEIADWLRTLNGSADAISPGEMNSILEAVAAEVDTQADLIAQIQEALEANLTGTKEVWIFTMENGTEIEKEIGVIS